MEWRIGLILGIVFIAIAIIYGLLLFFSKIKVRFPVVGFIICVFLGGSSLYFPMYYNMVEGDYVRGLKAVLMAAHNGLRMFALDGDFTFFSDVETPLADLGIPFRSAYHAFTIVYYIAAPVLSATFLLSFIKNLKAKFRFAFSINKELFVFSEINIKTVTLAKSIKENNKKACLIFCDVSEKVKEDNNELYESALETNAIIFEKDISSLNFKRHSKKMDKGVHLFIISDDDEKMLNQYNELVSQNKDRKNGKIYLFSRSSQGDLSFNQYSDKLISTRKYDSDFLIIYNYLYNSGVKLFETAKDTGHGTKKISIVIVGFGLNGKMLTKALAWYCQMTGYELEINVYDSDPLAKSKFKAEAPELLNPAFAHPHSKQETQFVINIHGGLDVSTYEFLQEIDMVADDTTFAFTCLGNDEKNLDTSMKLRMIFERHNNKAHIVSVVYSGKKEFVSKAKNFKNQDYDIVCIGSYETTYSYDFVINSELEKEAIKAHKRYCHNDEEMASLFSYAYNFRSSCASVIHKKARVALKIHGADKPANQLTQDDIEKTEILEHRRWAAYVRSEGYITGHRNDLAKMHHDLVLFDQLDRATRRKDSIVAIDKDPEDE